MREWNAATQRATLGVFANVVYSSPAAREVELWRVSKERRELRCVAVYMTTGIDLRLMEGDDSHAAAPGRACGGRESGRV